MSQKINVARAIKLASQFEIDDRDSGQRIPWILNSEQIRALNTLNDHKKVLFLKGRQIGMSTLSCYFVVLFASLNPKCTCSCFANVKHNTRGLLDKMEFFAQEMGILKDKTASLITLTNGSRIRGLSLSGSEGARATSNSLLYFSEIDFFNRLDNFSTILQTASLKAKIFIESTSGGQDGLIHQIWKDEKSEYEKVFFPVEEQALYQTDRELTSEEWKLFKELNYSNPKALAWFCDKKNQEYHGDLVAALRDYPNTPEQAFKVRSGLFMDVQPIVIPYVRQHDFHIFAEPDPAAKYHAGVDTGTGKGLDGSAIAILDASSGQLVASFRSNTVQVDELVDQMRWANEKYQPELFVVEANGVGQGTLALARKYNLPIKDIITNPSSKYMGLLAVKRQIEAGLLAGAEDLLEESKSISIRDTGRTKDFYGLKDLCMAIGFILPDILNNPYVAPTAAATNVFSYNKILKDKRRRKGNPF